MKRTKVFLSLFLMLFLVALPSLGQADTTLKYWLWLDDPTDTTVSELVDKFNSLHPEIRVVIENVPLKDYHDQLAIALSAGVGPDAARFKDWWLGEFREADLLEPLSSYIGEWPAKDDVIPNLWNMGRFQGKKKFI